MNTIKPHEIVYLNRIHEIEIFYEKVLSEIKKNFYMTLFEKKSLIWYEQIMNFIKIKINAYVHLNCQCLIMIYMYI